ncbi:guanine nucleotide-binding protein alpha-3 subunit, partial [Calocera cornea HHB12733]
GSGESGKSTVLKQMKIIHGGGFTPEELRQYKQIVRQNLIDSAQQLLRVMLQWGYRPNLGELPPDPVHALLDFQLLPGKNVPPWIVEAVILLWTAQPFMNEILMRSNEFYLMDNAPYFFKHALRICDKAYWPTNRDVLRSRLQTRGITKSLFAADRMLIHMYDVGGQRAERKKWIYAFENVKCVIFTAALSEYDQALLENPGQNRMLESMKLFENIIASRWFQNSVFMLFFNKVDVYEDKYARSPLNKYFPEYSGTDAAAGLKYIAYRYLRLNRAGVQMYYHITTATDTKKMRVITAAVREDIMASAIKDSGLI